MQAVGKIANCLEKRKALCHCRRHTKYGPLIKQLTCRVWQHVAQDAGRLERESSSLIADTKGDDLIFANTFIHMYEKSSASDGWCFKKREFFIEWVAKQNGNNSPGRILSFKYEAHIPRPLINVLGHKCSEFCHYANCNSARVKSLNKFSGNEAIIKSKQISLLGMVKFELLCR